MRADHLAHITAKNPVPDFILEIIRNDRFIFNGQVADAAIGVYGPVWLNAAGWASVNASPAGFAQVMRQGGI